MTSPCERSEREVTSPSILKVVGALDNYSLVFVIFINFFGQLKDWVGQVLFLVSCSKGQVEKYVNVEAWGSKAEKRKFQDVWKSECLWLIIYDYSSDVTSCDVCQKAGPDIADKTECVTRKKKFKRESLVYHNKSQKHEKCFNMVSAKAHSLTYTSTFLAPVNHQVLKNSQKKMKMDL